MTRTCRTCVYRAAGECHYGPPSVFTDRTTGWPAVAESDWCGQFKGAPTFVPAGRPARYSDESIIAVVRHNAPRREEGRTLAELHREIATAMSVSTLFHRLRSLCRKKVVVREGYRYWLLQAPPTSALEVE